MNAPQPTGHWHTVVLNWLFSQGVSTVLLFAILAGVYRGVPVWIEQQSTASKAQSDSFEQALLRQRSDFREILKEQRDDNNRAVQVMAETFTRTIERIEAK